MKKPLRPTKKSKNDSQGFLNWQLPLPPMNDIGKMYGDHVSAQGCALLVLVEVT